MAMDCVNTAQYSSVSMTPFQTTCVPSRSHIMVASDLEAELGTFVSWSKAGRSQSWSKDTVCALRDTTE